MHDPHCGRTLSHFVFFNRHVSHAVTALFLGYVTEVLDNDFADCNLFLKGRSSTGGFSGVVLRRFSFVELCEGEEESVGAGGGGAAATAGADAVKVCLSSSSVLTTGSWD